jgi:hypothetical protein
MYYPRLTESLEALPAKLFDIDLDPRKPAAVAHYEEQAAKEGHKGRIELNRERLRGATFTAHGDNEWVLGAYSNYVNRIANAVLNSGEASMARYQGGKNEAGQPHGFGTKSWADGIEYSGYWQDGQKHGDSETVWPDGTIYRGSYTHAKKNGPFVVSRKDGVVFIGTYANGQRIGQGVLWSTDRASAKLLQTVVEWQAAAFELVQGSPIPLEQAEAFVERLGVHLPDDSAASAMSTNARGRRLLRKEGYLAFVSHMKAEAAMEARFLQTELESLHKNDMVFLDSDDLRDLGKLREHVQQSRCLVLVQTRKVLTRPYCILELLTAIESQIPIVCVTVGGKPQEIAYNYEEMTKLMMWMDTELEQWNPGAADVLRDHGYEDLTDVAYRLSTIVPKTISVQLNTGDSRNRLHASIQDVVNAMKEARVPNLPDKAAWLAARSKMASPVKKMGRLKQHGI